MPEDEQPRPPWWLLLWQRRWWIALATLFILLWWLIPPLLYRHTGAGADARLKAITDTRTALLAGLIGIGALLTFWLNSRVYRITARTLEVTEQGHITERYTKAIEQLGSDKLDVRLGGIYALERIAKDSERDHPTVVEVLSAFVREHSHPARTTTPDPTLAEVLAALLRGRSEPAEVRQPAPDRSSDDEPNGSELSLKATTPREPATDVQAAVTVLGRLPRRSGVSRGDLSRALLAGAQLEGADLTGAQLYKANLSDAQLVRADLTGAELYKADLSGAGLVEANLSGARLYQANLTSAVLIRANLSGAELYGADLSGAVFYGANLSGAQVNEADLTETAALTQEQLNSARGDANTRLPDGLQRPDGWAPDQSSASTSS